MGSYTVIRLGSTKHWVLLYLRLFWVDYKLPFLQIPFFRPKYWVIYFVYYGPWHLSWAQWGLADLRGRRKGIENPTLWPGEESSCSAVELIQWRLRHEMDNGVTASALKGDWLPLAMGELGACGAFNCWKYMFCSCPKAGKKSVWGNAIDVGAYNHTSNIMSDKDLVETVCGD